MTGIHHQCNDRELGKTLGNGEGWTLMAGLAQSLVGSGAHRVLFEPSESLWRIWGLILKVILPLLQFCWGFSFALGHGISSLVGSNILLLMVVQQRVAILEFSQEKMSAL